MRVQSMRFRMNAKEAAIFDSVVREFHLKRSSVVRLICLFGPEPSSLYPDEFMFTINGCKYCDPSLLGKALVEVIRQETNIKQARTGFGQFLNGVGVDISKNDLLADPDRRPTIEAIYRCLDSTTKVISQVNDTVSAFAHDAASEGGSASGLDARVHARLEDDLYELLRLKAEAFGISVSDYFRLAVRHLPEVILFARECVAEDGFRFESLCLEVFDLNALIPRFRECGRVLNDATRYLNSEMLGYYKLSEIVLMLELRNFLGKLEVAVGFYRCFCDEFGFKFEE